MQGELAEMMNCSFGAGAHLVTRRQMVAWRGAIFVRIILVERVGEVSVARAINRLVVVCFSVGGSFRLVETLLLLTKQAWIRCPRRDEGDGTLPVLFYLFHRCFGSGIRILTLGVTFRGWSDCFPFK